MPARIALLALILVLVVPATSEAKVTLSVSGDKYRERLYPDTFRIKGTTGDYRGPVTVEVDEFPYDGAYADAGTVNTTSKGGYVFPKVGPSRNARVRVRAGSERSKSVAVFVHPGVKRKERRISNDRFDVSFAYLGHPGFSPPADSFFVYLYKAGSKKLQRLGTARTMAHVGDGKWRYRGTVKIPKKGSYRFGFAYCTRGLSASGYGRAYAIDRSCGDRYIPFSNPD
jgi:hypothetical protein